MPRAALLTVAVLIGGCAPATEPAPVTKPPYTFEVGGAGGVATGQSAVEFNIQRNEVSAAVKDGSLTANGKSYGPVPDGAKIVVKDDGTVLVNGEEKQPID